MGNPWSRCREDSTFRCRGLVGPYGPGGIDRLYLNVYVPLLQTGAGASHFFRHPVPSLMIPMTRHNIADVRKDFLPNRHAAVHGLVAYSEHKHSMNMLVMTDCIFQMLPSAESAR